MYEFTPPETVHEFLRLTLDLLALSATPLNPKDGLSFPHQTLLESPTPHITPLEPHNMTQLCHHPLTTSLAGWVSHHAHIYQIDVLGECTHGLVSHTPNYVVSHVHLQTQQELHSWDGHHQRTHRRIMQTTITHIQSQLAQVGEIPHQSHHHVLRVCPQLQATQIQVQFAQLSPTIQTYNLHIVLQQCTWAIDLACGEVRWTTHQLPDEVEVG